MTHPTTYVWIAAFATLEIATALVISGCNEKPIPPEECVPSTRAGVGLSSTTIPRFAPTAAGSSVMPVGFRPSLMLVCCVFWPRISPRNWTRCSMEFCAR